ncbi:MAG: hypothetical protein KDE27_21955 [Planctomycetes bacterium]|nr:hypothetical protein [Planctomycetota bacterium]
MWLFLGNTIGSPVNLQNHGEAPGCFMWVDSPWANAIMSWQNAAFRITINIPNDPSFAGVELAIQGLGLAPRRGPDRAGDSLCVRPLTTDSGRIGAVLSRPGTNSTRSPNRP